MIQTSLARSIKEEEGDKTSQKKGRALILLCLLWHLLDFLSKTKKFPLKIKLKAFKMKINVSDSV
jgi:hypothetical protein